MFEMIPFDRRRNSLYAFPDWDALEKRFFGAQELTAFHTDVRDTGDAYELQADLPGFDKENIQVSLENDTLTIAAVRRSAREENKPNGEYLFRERSYGTFRRSFSVNNIDTANITAAYENGVLTLRLPKQTPAQAQRSIPIA